MKIRASGQTLITILNPLTLTHLNSSHSLMYIYAFHHSQSLYFYFQTRKLIIEKGQLKTYKSHRSTYASMVQLHVQVITRTG